MLQTLRVKNLAIVENVRADFDSGLNVITGETGAGKSILVGALGLVLGERADKSMIRAGEDRCGVEATFALQDSSDVDALLEDLGVNPCEDGRLITRRIIAAAGAGKTLINDTPVTLQALKQLGNLLVDMHGPHDHQSLLNEAFQMDLLDSFGHLWGARDEYEATYREMMKLHEQRQVLDSDDQQVAEQIDLLSYQVREIEEAKLDEMDEEELDREHARVANAQRILEVAGGVQQALTEGEGAAFDALVNAQRALQELAGILEEAETWRTEAESAAITVQELSHSINSTMDSIEADPARLEWLEERKALLHKLKRKYGSSVQEILERLEQSRERLLDLETRGEQLAEIDEKTAAARETVIAFGTALGKARGKTARELGKAVTRELQDLGFPHGAFEVGLEDADPGPTGMQAVEFGFAPNQGEPMRPLRAIASSGEISRVMLACKAVLAAHDRIPVLVFDEIDTNLGGEMGHAVGEKMEAVASTHQVLCITHLPQVAVHGQVHCVVSKSVSGGRTRTEIHPVSGKQRVAEVARMLGDTEGERVALEHAARMLGKGRRARGTGDE